MDKIKITYKNRTCQEKKKKPSNGYKKIGEKLQ